VELHLKMLKLDWVGISKRLMVCWIQSVPPMKNCVFTLRRSLVIAIWSNNYHQNSVV